tara:strand:- start:263 stop:1294 length:1032 start_codon:yes stop_codon:yes gene_type:complete
MGTLLDRFDSIPTDEKTVVLNLIHGELNVYIENSKLIFDNNSEPMDESEYLQLYNVVKKYFSNDEWELIHCNLGSSFKNTRVVDSQYPRTYNHVKGSPNWRFIPYDVDKLKSKREKVFLFYNGSCGDRAVHRLMSFHYLLDYGILDKTLYSMLESPTNVTYSTLSGYDSQFNSGVNWKKHQDFFERAPFLLDVDLGEHNFVDLNDIYDSEPANSLDLPFSHIQKTYFSLVTESFFFEPHWCKDKSLFDISEKTYKAVLTQPFIIMARPGILKYLREKGFDTFDDVFDNSYDEIKDDWERFQSIMKEVKRVCDLEQETLHELYLNCVDRVVNNQQKFLSYEGKI